eukprot:jgi/Mesen1/11073/ME000099S10518
MANSRSQTTYAVLLTSVLQRLRFPKYQLLVREALGEDKNRAAIRETGYFDSAEQRVVAAAQAAEADRFRLPYSMASYGLSDGDTWTAGSGPPAAAEPNEDLDVKPALLKRKRDEMGKKSGSSGGGGDAGKAKAMAAVTGVGAEESAACVAHIKERFDAAASLVVSAVLAAAGTRAQEESVRYRSIKSMALEAVAQAVRQTAEGRTVTMDRVRASLQALAADGAGMVTRSSDVLGGALYSFHLYKMIENLRMREVEVVVAQRFGPSACRIFRLLLLKKHLEQKQIGEMAMIPLKDSRELLYNMLKENLEIAKSADRAPSRSFFLWYIDLPGVMNNVVDSMCKGASNLRQRLAHELEQEQEVLALLEQIQQSSMQDRPSSGAQAVTLTAGQRKQLERVRRVAAVLETSLLRLDDSIMLFLDF